MAHLLQVGAGSGGMPVLDAVCRDPRISHVTLIEPDVYKPHNVERHLFPLEAVGSLKAELAGSWLAERRPDLEVTLLVCDLLDAACRPAIEQAVATADLGICAVDNEPAKYHWDELMRRYQKPWTLGEVLSGGIGGFVHWFIAGGPCYGCVASHLQRSVTVDRPPTPDYSAPGGPVHETTIPASKASIQAIAALHALVTLDLLAGPAEYAPGFTSLLFTLQRVPDVFDEAFRPYRFRIARSVECLICRTPAEPSDGSAPRWRTSMLPLIKRWRDWAMHDLWPLYRLGPQPQAVHYSYEKAGLTVCDQPIPWNAEAVLVEASLRLKSNAVRRKGDFQLRVPNRELLPAESLRRQEADEHYRVLFRLPPLAATTAVQVLWRDHILGDLTLPVVSREEFIQNLRLQMPTAFREAGRRDRRLPDLRFHAVPRPDC